MTTRLSSARLLWPLACVVNVGVTGASPNIAKSQNTTKRFSSLIPRLAGACLLARMADPVLLDHSGSHVAFVADRGISAGTAVGATPAAGSPSPIGVVGARAVSGIAR